MNTLTKVLAGLLAISAFWLWWVTDDYDKLSKDYNTATSQLSRQNSITENANRTFRIINNVSSLNSEERNRSAVDSEKVKTVIKTVLINNDCANTAIP
ncbi:hypothetical protein, partial [Proteus vulgaris]|uniref:hypothetical protein n=1 Tax=Proteus vulgaris TaxID=585 RepID=UPI00288ACD73